MNHLSNQNIVKIILGLVICMYVIMPASAQVVIEGPVQLKTLSDTSGSDLPVVVRQSDGTVGVALVYEPSGNGNIHFVPHENYKHYGNGFQEVLVSKYHNRVIIDGLLRKKTGNVTAGDLLGTLSLEFRPRKIMTLFTGQNESTVRVNIYPDGRIVVMSVPSSPIDWLSFSSFSFYRNEELKVGDYAQGGVIFYLASGVEDLNGDGNPDQGMVVTEVDVQDGSWGCYGTEITGMSNGDFGNGAKDTESIVAQCAEQGIAAKRCHDLVHNGYSDWFLPSIIELMVMNNSVGYVAPAPLNNPANITPPSNTYYWSSSQYNNNNARAADLKQNSQISLFKIEGRRMRAMRVF